MGKNKQIAINMVASILALGVSFGIGFFLTPFIVGRLGDEAYGFVSLANNFVTYGSLITVALNSMASRFITIAIRRGENKKAGMYFNSLLVSDILISVVLIIAAIFIIIFLNNIVDVSPQLYHDVQITFGFAFLNFIITVLATAFTIVTFVKNHLEEKSKRDIVSSLMRVVLLVGLFSVFTPRIYYVSMAAVICSVYYSFSHIRLTRKLLSEVNVNVKQFRWSAVKEMLSSGIWNTVNNLSTILLYNLDVLLANWFVSKEAMGTMSIATMLPNVVSTVTATIANAFAPHFTALYALDQKQELIDEVKLSIKTLSVIMTVPIAGIIAFGFAFYSLWLPEKTAGEIMVIQILSILNMAPNTIGAYVHSLYAINTVVNKLRTPVLVYFGVSVVSIITTVILLKTTNLGMYAIAGVSSVLIIGRILTFVPMYAAHNLKVKLTTFYPPLLRAILCLVITLALYFTINHFVTITSWLSFAGVMAVCAVIGYIVNFLVILNSKERKKILNMIASKLKIN